MVRTDTHRYSVAHVRTHPQTTARVSRENYSTRGLKPSGTKKTHSRFLLDTSLGWKNRKQVQTDPDGVWKDTSFELNPSFLALSVQKLWKISWDMSNPEWSTWKRQFLSFCFCWIHWVDYLYESKWNKGFAWLQTSLKSANFGTKQRFLRHSLKII